MLLCTRNRRAWGRDMPPLRSQSAWAGLNDQGLPVTWGPDFAKEPPVANPVQFINQVRAEAAKITWPTRREVVTTTIMVFIMAALTSLFFFLVDLVIRFGLTEGLRAITG